MRKLIEEKGDFWYISIMDWTHMNTKNIFTKLTVFLSGQKKFLIFCFYLFLWTPFIFKKNSLLLCLLLNTFWVICYILVPCCFVVNSISSCTRYLHCMHSKSYIQNLHDCRHSRNMRTINTWFMNTGEQEYGC